MNVKSPQRAQKVVMLLFQLFFWLWNLSTSAIAYLGILPFIGLWLIRDTVAGLIPFDFFLTLCLLVIVPTAGTILGAGRYAKPPIQLMRLFYGLEAPLFLLAVLRLFLIRERTMASTFLLLTFGIAIAAFAFELFSEQLRQQRQAEWYRPKARRKSHFARWQLRWQRQLEWLNLLTHTLMFLVGSYVAVLLAFYAFPAAFEFLKGFLSFQWVGWLFDGLTHADNLVWLFMLCVGTISFVLTVIAFITLPSGFASIYTYAAARYGQYFASRHGKSVTGIAVAVICVIWLALGSLLQSQPQIEAFGLLANTPPNADARRELLAQQDLIRKGLLNAYLHAYRYLSSREENNHIREMYHDVFGLDRDVTQVIQNAYSAVVAPLLYRGFSTDDDKAAQLYAEFFDRPIQKGERRAIEHALQSTYNRDDAKAGLLNINQEKVWLASQQVTVEPHGAWANVELYEVYENMTFDEQEVFYSFALPESAVITGLWLGHSADREQRFEFQVSPRGAAQQVYNNQVQWRRDPALVEQVGLRHYRLRAFPIPPRELTAKLLEKPKPPQFHLWLTYAVLRQNDAWPLPHLGERRNVFWTKKTRVNYNGYTRRHPGEDWLPESLSANLPTRIEPQTVTFPGGYALTLKPLSAQDLALPTGKRFAVLLDTSYSVKTHVKKIQATIDWLQSTLSKENDLDVYLTDANPDWARRLDDVGELDAQKLLFFGTIQFQDMLRQFDQQRGDTAYDAILLVTDEGSYELAGNDTDIPSMPAPLWLVHVSGLPKAYDDATLEAIQHSSGGVSTSVEDVVQRLATTSALISNAAALGEAVVSVVDGYVWFLKAPQVGQNQSTHSWQDGHSTGIVFPTYSSLVVSAANADGLTALAARQLTLGLSQRLDMSALKNLDGIHAIAKTYRIVSPYSSMIVLVNEQQKRELEQAEAQTDRFDREVESGHEVLEAPNNPLNNPVPEPGTLFMVGIGLSLPGWLEFRRRKHPCLTLPQIDGEERR